MEYQFSNKINGLKPSAIREILKATADPSIIPFAAGNPAPEAFPTREIQEITQKVWANNAIGALQYSITEGYTPLRDTLKQRLREKDGIGREFDELIIVSGAQQGIELACKCLCNEGDVVICENPSFIGSLNSFRSYGVKLVGAEVEPDGINLQQLEQALQENKNARFLYLIPNFQNPSGVTMSMEKRRAVYALARQYNVLIIEDNPYGDLRFSGEDLPSIKSLDEDGRVIYVGSFSKTMAPGLRVGFTIADKQIISKMTVAKQGEDVHTNILSQIICHEFMTAYDFDAHLKNLQAIYRKKADLMLAGMQEHFSPAIHYIKPQGGLFIWCSLPAGSDMLGFCTKAVQRQVAVVPGNAFTANESDVTTSFRMNYSTPTDEDIVKGTKILGDLTKELF